MTDRDDRQRERERKRERETEFKTIFKTVLKFKKIDTLLTIMTRAMRFSLIFSSY